MRHRPLLAFALLLLLRPHGAAIAEDTGAPLEIELSMTLDPAIQTGMGRDVTTLNVPAATDRLLGEARDIVSGMIYGYRFDYTPSDQSRGVAEVFDLEPLARIPRGDQALSIADTRLEGRKLTVLFRYTLSPEQHGWRDAWSSGTLEKAAGEGTGNAFLGYDERTTALVNALKESIRSNLRPHVLNKPRRVLGDLVLWDVSPTRITAGEYHTRVVTRLRVDSVIPYLAY